MSELDWAAAPGYLNVSTLGLPPRATARALGGALQAWQSGLAQPKFYDIDVARARQLYADLVDVPVATVAIGSQASVMVGMVAAAVPEDARVLTVAGEFTSVTAPFEAQAARGVQVRAAPLDGLAEAVRASRPQVVAFSLAQSSDGTLADAERVRSAASEVGALTVCDTSQAVGWLPVAASGWDVTVCSAYKWLCAPRGAAFLTVAPEAMDRLAEHNRGPFAGEDVGGSIYGLQLQPARNARRFDVSPAWLAWVGARSSLEVLLALPSSTRRRHGADLADQLRDLLGLPSQGRPVLSLADPDGSRLARLEAAGCRVAARAGSARISFHLWNDAEDVARVASAVT